MGGIIVETGARMAACEDFDSDANANPYPKQSDAWRFYEAEYQSLTDSKLVVYGQPN
jgi:hypothetical protein